jgi:hypothetical protein
MNKREVFPPKLSSASNRRNLPESDLGLDVGEADAILAGLAMC